MTLQFVRTFNEAVDYKCDMLQVFYHGCREQLSNHSRAVEYLQSCQLFSSCLSFRGLTSICEERIGKVRFASTAWFVNSE
jgi:hypothetical protein